MKETLTAGELRAVLAQLSDDASISFTVSRVLPARVRFANAVLRFVAAFVSGMVFANGVFHYAVGGSALVPLLLSVAYAVIAWLWPGDRR